MEEPTWLAFTEQTVVQTSSHGGGLVAPSDDALWAKKHQQSLLQAYEQHPERFVRGKPKPPTKTGEVWINKPEKDWRYRGCS